MNEDTTAAVETPQGDAPAVETQVAEAAPAQAETAAHEDKSWQSRHDRLLNEVSTDLLGYVKNYGGGKNVAGFLKQFEQVLGHAQLGPVVQELLRTGNVTLPKPASTDPWAETPEEPEWKKEINPLLAELQSVRQELTAMKGQQGMAKISGHTASFLKEYPLSDQEKARFVSAMEEKLAGFAGNPNGASILNAMDYRTFKSIALPEIEEDLANIVARKVASQRTRVSGAATDAATNVGATASEKKPIGAPPKNFAELQANVRKALREGLVH